MRQMIRINQVKLPEEHTFGQIKEKAAKLLKCREEDIQKLHIIKKSIDARKKPVLFYNYVVEVEMDKEEMWVKRAKDNNISLVTPHSYHFPEVEVKGMSAKPIIIGEGPAGLFCGYFLAMAGFSPLILERGKDVDRRQKEVENFWQTGILNPESNVQFGEGGAGTFSDGKLNTLIKDKDGKGRKVLELLVQCGAPERILYENKPHIGTDILVTVVKNLRCKIEEMGGEVRFESQVTDLCLEEDENGGSKICGVIVNGRERINSQIVVLAIGHSARNTFEMLHKRRVPMEAKSFAVGFRVEHPQKMIDYNQYGKESRNLPAASYKLTAQTSVNRGVYSFCMCPGGYVVNASSEEGRLAVNGMSYSGRDGKNANSAIIVAVTPKDFAAEETEEISPLAGLEFQRKLEEKAYIAGKGKVPVQRYGDYRNALKKRLNIAETESSFWTENTADAFTEEELSPGIKGEYVMADLSDILPKECGWAFVEGMEQFNRSIPGFASGAALLSGVESRTSSPVRICRDETGQSVIKGLFPCGEGAGYAGGITSAAMDGILTAEKIAGLTKLISSSRIE